MRSFISNLIPHILNNEQDMSFKQSNESKIKLIIKQFTGFQRFTNCIVQVQTNLLN